MGNKLATLELIKDCVEYAAEQNGSSNGEILDGVTVEDFADMFELIETLKGFFNAASHR